ncbi:MAG: hypothetical protein U0Q07_08850 [Acidimicrobiales bacterium]
MGRSWRDEPVERWDPNVCRDYTPADLARLGHESRVVRIRRASLDQDLFLHGVRYGWWDPDGRLPPSWSDDYRRVVEQAAARRLALSRPAGAPLVPEPERVGWARRWRLRHRDRPVRRAEGP